MPSKESLERSWKFRGHHTGCACSDCWALADLLDEAIREARVAEVKRIKECVQKAFDSQRLAGPTDGRIALSWVLGRFREHLDNIQAEASGCNSRQASSEAGAAVKRKQPKFKVGQVVMFRHNETNHYERIAAIQTIKGRRLALTEHGYVSNLYKFRVLTSREKGQP